ncbi:MAG: hypothetical protein L3J56_02115 [Bacteroidales bacterium]|nr:hypothetical protein [Bacteroidales bacterium]
MFQKPPQNHILNVSCKAKRQKRKNKMFANKEKIESHRTVSTFAIRTSQSQNRKLQKSLPLPTLEEILNIKKEIKIYG